MSELTDEPKTEVKSSGYEPHFNRHTRRARQAYEQKLAKISNAVSQKRLDMFNLLMEWKEKATAAGKMTDDQVSSVFKVALAKLFKQNFKSEQEFENKLAAIVQNVVDGFKYQEDVPTPILPTVEEAKTEEAKTEEVQGV